MQNFILVYKRNEIYITYQQTVDHCSFLCALCTVSCSIWTVTLIGRYIDNKIASNWAENL